MDIHVPLIDDTFHAPLSKNIQKTYNTLATLLIKCPVDLYTMQSIPGTGGMVSIADIIAYQIGWATLLIGWYEAGLEGRKPPMPSQEFATWDYTGLAQHFYTKYRYDNADTQLQIFHTRVRRIITIVETEYKKNNLDVLNVWSWCTLPSGKQWPLSKWVTVNSVAPYKRAIRLINTMFKESFD